MCMMCDVWYFRNKTLSPVIYAPLLGRKVARIPLFHCGTLTVLLHVVYN